MLLPQGRTDLPVGSQARTFLHCSNARSLLVHRNPTSLLFSKAMLVHRPWGTYETLLDDDNYKVKRIIILPQQQISLQFHNDREEHWTIVSGSGTVRVGDDTFKAVLGSRFFINKRQIHRATADKDSHLVFVEVQLGDCNENDIVRLEDQYGREGFKYED